MRWLLLFHGLACHRPDAPLPPKLGESEKPKWDDTTSETGPATVTISGPADGSWAGADVWIPPTWRAVPTSGGVRLESEDGVQVVVRNMAYIQAETCAVQVVNPGSRRMEVPWLGTATLRACWPSEPGGEVVWTWASMDGARWVDLIAPLGRTTSAWERAEPILARIRNADAGTMPP